MGQHKHNSTAIAAAKGELPPKKRERRLTKRQAERLLRLKIIQTIDPFHALPDGMAGGMKKMTRTAQIGEGFQTRSLTGIAATENGGKNKG